MKVTILHSDIYSPLQAVSRSIAAKPQLPVLNNVLLQADSGVLTISATNLEIGIIKKINADVIEAGDITVPAKILTEIMSGLSGEKVSLESSLDQLKISTQNFSGTLNGISATEFPTIPVSSDNNFSLDAALLQQSLPQISFAAAIDEARPVLTGIFTEIKDQKLEVVATDGFRLAHKKSKLDESNSKQNFKSLIPRRTFEEVIKVIAEESQSNLDTLKLIISTSENQNQMIFQIGKTIISSRLIEGTYPTWERIVPTTFKSFATVDRYDFMKSIKLASVFARDAANIVKMDVGKNKIKVFSEARELGQQETELEAKTEGEPLIIAFNNKYLLDALNNCHSKEVKLNFSGNLSATLIQPLEEEGLEYVVMPIRIT